MTRRQFRAQKDLFAPDRPIAGLTPAQHRTLVPLIEVLLAEVAAADTVQAIALAADGLEARDEDHA